MGLLAKKHVRLGGNVIPLISFTFALFALFILFTFISLDRYLDQLNDVTETGNINSQKMRLNAELMELARSRTRLTSQIIDTEDIFEQDELNMTLEGYAGVFANKRAQILSLELSPEEIDLLNAQTELVPAILPAQRQVVALAMNGNLADKQNAATLFYEKVLPNQGQMISLLAKLISIEQQMILEQGEDSQTDAQAMRKKSVWLIGAVFIAIAILSIIVIIRIRHIQEDLLTSHENLELKILDRTSELKNTQGMLSTVIDTIPAGVFWIDIAGTYLGSNIVFSKDMGYTTSAELIGKSLTDMPKKSIAMEFYDDIEDVRSSNSELSKVIKHIKSDGDISWVEMALIPLSDKRGMVIGILGVYQDITQRKESEKNLQSAMISAKNANISKSLFLANMSHELRTPMHAILSFSHIGYKKINSDPREKLGEYFVNISSSGNRLLLLLNDLLDLSKLEAGRMEFQFQMDDFNKVITAAIKELNALLTQHQLSINVTDSDVGASAYFDPHRIFQVIVNLISNAIKYSSEGGSIAISLADAELNGLDAISCSVIDEGIGIPADELEIIFDQFAQSSKTHSGAGGTGLGLAICKEIIEGHKGTIAANNNPSGGAIVTFVIPRNPSTKTNPT